MSTTLRLLVGLAACLLALPAWSATASVDRARLSENETLELRIRVEGSGDEAPDLAPLARDFELLSNSRNSRVSLINGRGESFTEWVIALAPRRAGELTIPALTVGAGRTGPIRVQVLPEDGAPAATPGTQDIALEVLPGAKEVHVQQQLLLTVRLLHAVDLANGATLEEPAIDGAVVRKLGEGSHETRIGGRRYGVFERRYAVFPQASGELLIPRLRFDASVGGGSLFDRFGAGKRVRLRSAEQRIRVLAPEQGAAPWLPARLITLVETWDRSPQELAVGESATRTLTLSANGLTGAQLPALPAIASEGLRAYPDKPEIGDESGEDGITGTRTERTAVIPARAGEIELPELRLRWWDTINRRFEEAVVPARTIRVRGPAAPAAPPVAAVDPLTAPAAAGDAPDAQAIAATDDGGDTLALRAWQAACAVLAACALLCFVQWRRALLARAAPAPSPRLRTTDEPARFAALREACTKNDAAVVPVLLLDWARTVLPEAPRSLAEVPQGLGTPELQLLVDALQGSRYGRDGGAWNGSALLAVLERIRASLPAHDAGAGVLPPLYRDRGAFRQRSS